MLSVISKTESKTEPKVRLTGYGRHIPALDGIRGIAILLVLCHHYRFILEPVHRSQKVLLVVFDAGWCGVELFFVLSGFLITGILLDTRSSSSYFRSFYARRLLRISPLYFFYLAVVFACLSRWWLVHFKFDPWAGVSPWTYILYLENFKTPHMFSDLLLGHLWSLAVEEQFYIFWPVVVALLPRRFVCWSALLLICAAVLCRFTRAGHDLQSSFYLNTFPIASLDSLGLGALAALLLRTWKSPGRVAPVFALVGIASFATFVGLSYKEGSPFLYNRLVHVWGVLALSVFSACLILWCALRGSSAVARLLSFRPLREIGRVSYGMYVWHSVLLAFLLPLVHPISPGMPPAVQTATKLSVMIGLAGATYLFAVLSWALLERPILSLKKYFEYHVSQDQVLLDRRTLHK